MGTEPQAPHSNSGTSATMGMLARRLEESFRLSRFFTKLLGEAFHLGAESISFVTQGDELNVVMRRERNELKTIRIKATWFDPIHAWLLARLFVLAETGGTPGSTSETAAGQSAFTSAVRFGEEIAIGDVTLDTQPNGQRSLVFASMRRLPRQQLIDRLALSPLSRIQFENIFNGENGIIVLSAPSAEQLRLNVAVMSTLTGLPLGGSLDEQELRAELAVASKREPLFITTRAADAVDALLKLRESGVDFGSTRIIGSLCQGFIRRNCPACARKASVDKNLVKDIPPQLLPVSWDAYCVGRGCEQCGQRGQLGVLGVQSLAVASGDVAAALAGGKPAEIIVAAAYDMGTRTLLQDGIPKVTSGQSTLEALSALSTYFPPEYASALQRSTQNSSPGTRETPSAGAAHTAAEGDAPLFPAQAAKPAVKRQRPLVLVVEDDADQRSILDMVFRASNYDVVLTANGKDALERLKGISPDIIVSDLMMPEMDGSELLTRLKADAQYSNIPVLILTVVSDSDREYSLLDLGADDYCEKTVQRKILLKRVQNLIKRAQR